MTGRIMAGDQQDTPENRLPRVVQVGFNKCATRSLTRLFAGSGHRAAHHKFKHPLGLRKSRNIAEMMRANIRAGRKVFAGFEDYTFYADLMLQTRHETWEAFKEFRRILADYPDTILLLNTRDRENWIRSRLRHGHGTFAEMAMQANGLSSLEELADFWRADWDRHLADVRSYMADRPEQLVEFDTDREPVSALIARLPQYRLKEEAWGDTGRSRGRRPGRWREALHRLNARRRMR